MKKCGPRLSTSSSPPPTLGPLRIVPPTVSEPGIWRVETATGAPLTFPIPSVCYRSPPSSSSSSHSSSSLPSSATPPRSGMSRLASAVAAIVFSHLDAGDHLRAGRCSRALRQQSLQSTSMAPTMTIRLTVPVRRSDRLRVLPLQHLTLHADTPKYADRRPHDVRHSVGAAVAVLAAALGKTDVPAPSSARRPTVSLQNVLQRVTLVGFWRESLPSVARIPAREVELRNVECRSFAGGDAAYARRIWSQLADVDRLEAFRYPDLPLVDASIAPGRRLQTFEIGRLFCRRVDCETTFRTVTDLSLSLSTAPDQTLETVLRVAPLRRLVLREASAYLTTRLGTEPRLARTLRTLEIERPRALCLRDIAGLTALTALRITEPHAHRHFAVHLVVNGIDYRGLSSLSRLERLDLATTVAGKCVACRELTVRLPFLPELREFRAPFTMSFGSLGQQSDPTGHGGADTTRLPVFPRLERLHLGAASTIEAHSATAIEHHTDGEQELAQNSTGGGGGGGGSVTRSASLALGALLAHTHLRSLHIGAHTVAERDLRDLAPGGSRRAKFPVLECVVGDRREILLAEFAAYRLVRTVSLA